MKNGKTIIKAGVIGDPIDHSLSPAIYNYWLSYYGIAGEYKAYKVKEVDLKQFLTKKIFKLGLAGVNITVPHKVTAMQWAKCDAPALIIGAINTVTVEGKELKATNTDYRGFKASVEEKVSKGFKGKKAAILGAGGAAHAVAAAVASMAVAELIIINRTVDKAKALKERLERLEWGWRPSIEVRSWDFREEALERAALLVNTTSSGMKGKEPLAISLEALPKSAWVVDIVYNPLETELLKTAKYRGNKTIDGLGMLLHQAAPGFKAWFDKEGKITGPKGPEVTEALRRHVEKVLAERRSS